MRVAFFFEIFYPQINGVLTATVNLAQNLKKRGHEVFYLATKNKEFTETEVDGIPVFYLPSIPFFIYPGIQVNWPWSRSLRKILKNKQVDILHFTGPFTMGLAALKYGKKYKVPVVHTFHTMINETSYLKYLFKFNWLIPLGRRFVWNFISVFIKQSSLITAPSLYVRDEVTTRFPHKEVLHISNGIEMDDFKNPAGFAALKKSYPFFNDKTFVYVGRLGGEKSIDIVIRAVKTAIAQEPGIHFLIVGNGPGRESLEKLTRKLDLGSHVHFAGKIEHNTLLKSGILHNARAFVTASKTENQPMTIIEAICCGCPIIIPDLRGINELMDNNGFLFPADQIQDLAEKLITMARDNTLVEKFKNYSFKLSQRYDGSNVAAEFEDAYRKLL